MSLIYNMINFKNSGRILFIISACFLNLNAQDHARSFVVSPFPFASGTFSTSIGLSLTVIPRLIVEEGVVQLPMLEARTKYGITDNFYLTGRVNIVYITNQITIGAGWSFANNNCSVSISDHFGYWFGFADFKGFDASSMGLANYPTISIGMKVNELYLTLSGEALINLSQHTYFGSASVGRFKPEYVGYAVSFAIEDEIWKDNIILFGARFQYSLPIYQTWVAFSTSYRWALFPEFFIGYEF